MLETSLMNSGICLHACINVLENSNHTQILLLLYTLLTCSLFFITVQVHLNRFIVIFGQAITDHLLETKNDDNTAVNAVINISMCNINKLTEDGIQTPALKYHI